MQHENQGMGALHHPELKHYSGKDNLANKKGRRERNRREGRNRKRKEDKKNDGINCMKLDWLPNSGRLGIFMNIDPSDKCKT